MKLLTTKYKFIPDPELIGSSYSARRGNLTMCVSNLEFKEVDINDLFKLK